MTEETAKFVISVIVIILLIMFVVNLVKIFRASTDYEKAKVVMSDVEETFSSMAKNDAKVLLIEGPKGWVFLTNRDRVCLVKLDMLEDLRQSGQTSRNSMSVCSSKLGNVSILDSCNSVEWSDFFTGVTSSGTGSTECLLLAPLPFYLHGYSDGATTYFSASDKISSSKILPQPNVPVITWKLENVADGSKDVSFILSSSKDLKDTSSLVLDGLFLESVVKKKAFFSDSPDFKKKTDAYVNSKIGALYLTSGINNKGYIYLRDPLDGNARDRIGKIDETGRVWLAKDVLEEFFDLSADLSFSEERKVIPLGWSIGGLLDLVTRSKNYETYYNQLTTSHEVYRTNLITDPSLGSKF